MCVCVCVCVCVFGGKGVIGSGGGVCVRVSERVCVMCVFVCMGMCVRVCGVGGMGDAVACK